MERKITNDIDLNLKETELRLGLPGTTTEEPNKMPTTVARSNKRALPELAEESNRRRQNAPPAKEQVVGWPPIRSYRKNSLQVKTAEAESGGMYVKVSMDGAPFLRKMDLNVYKSYPGLLKALENMFKCTIDDYSERDGCNGSEYAATYEDKDGDWMLVGDVPWEMFHCSCKRLRIMKGSEARGLGCAWKT